MDWAVRPLHATSLQARDFQVQGLYQSQQPASGFSQASALTQNSSAYIRNDQAIKIHSSTENMVPNRLSPQGNVGSNNFQSPGIGFGTTQHFVGQHSHMRHSSMTVQMASGMAMNTQTNSNGHMFFPAAPQLSTANPVQKPRNQYISSDMYNNRPQKNCSSSVQGSGILGNKNSSHSKRLPLIFPQYQPANPQTQATVPLNEISSHFLNSQQNSSGLSFPSGPNFQNQINDINSGSATIMQSQQNASNCAYSSPYTLPTYYTTQVIPQTTNTNVPPPPYAVPSIRINNGQFVPSQPIPNTSNQNVQNSELAQSGVPYSVQHIQIPVSVPVSEETNVVGGVTGSMCERDEKQPSDELRKSATEALKSLRNDLQVPGSLPLDNMSTPQTTRSIVEVNTAKSSGNTLDSLIKSTSMKKSLELDKQKILAKKNELSKMVKDFNLKIQLYRSVAQKSKTSDSSVHNPTPNTSQQPASLPQTTHQTFSLPSHNTTQNPISLLPHDNAQQIQDSSLQPLKTKNHLYPILQDLLKGTIDEELLLNSKVASTERNQSKQLFFQETCSTGSALESNSVKSETSVNDVERASRLSPGTSQTVSTQGSLTSTNASLDFEQTSLGKLINMSTMSAGDLFTGLVLSKDKVGTSVTKILSNPQSTVSVQKPAESSQLTENLVKEGNKNSQNPSSEFLQESEDNCLQTPDKSITAWNNGNDISNSDSLAATIPEAGKVQRSSFTGNFCTVGRTCSLEELETSLALWKKSPTASLNDKLGENTKSTMRPSTLNGVEGKEMECTMKNLPSALTHCENSSNEPALSSVTSSLGQKFDTVSLGSSKSSEPQVAIVPPLILSKEGIQNEVQENDLSSMLEKMYRVITEGNVHSLHKFVLTSDVDKPIKRTPCSPSDFCVDSNIPQKTTKSTEENGIQRTESGTLYYGDPSERLTGPSEMEKNTSKLYSRDSFPPEINKDSSSPISQKCAPETSQDLVEPQVSVLHENMLQISSVCTLVQGDAFYNSQIANIFNTNSKVEDNTSSEDQRPVSYLKEQRLSPWKRESEMNENTSVGDALLPSLGTLSKTIAEKLLSLQGLKMHQGGEVKEREYKEEKNTELVNPNSGKEPEQNMSSCDDYSRDFASGNQELPENGIADEGSAHGIQDYVSSDRTQLHSVDNVDLTLTLPDDQLTELVKEFPYGIDSKTLKKTENEDSATKMNELKGGQEIQTCGQNSEVNHAADQIIVTILNPQQMKELFPEYSSRSSDELENRANDKLAIASENTAKGHVNTILIESTDTATETVQKPASHSFCCVQAWLALKYSVEPCKHMLAKEAAFEQQLVQNLPSEIKERSETKKNSSSNCQLNSQQQTIHPVFNNLPSEIESNQMLTKPFACRESDLQEKECKSLKEDNGLAPCTFSEKLELLKPKNKEQDMEELPGKVQIDELCNQKCTTLVSKSQELLSSACKKEPSDNGKTPKEKVVDKLKSYTFQHTSMENNHSKKEKYKIKRDSSETHIIKGPTRTFKKGFKKHIASQWKQKTEERSCSTVTNSSNLSNVGLVSKVLNNGQHSQEHLKRQKCKIKGDLENNKALREHSESRRSELSSEPMEHNKGTFAITSLKKFAYPEERGNSWRYRRSLSENIKTSKVQKFRGQHLNMHKGHSSGKEVVWGAYKRDKSFAKTLSDKKSPCNKRSNTLTLQREQKKNYLNKVAFKQTERSICLTKLEQSPSKSVWHVKSSSASEHPEDKKDCIPSSQQSEAVKPQMLEFKMCPETVFRNLVSEDVSDAEKLPEKERIPVAAVKSKREDWLNYTPPKRRKTDEKETQVDDRVPLDTAVLLLDKNEAVKNSNAIFETYRKMHLEKSRSLDSSPIN